MKVIDSIPDYADRERYLRLRCQSKTGSTLSRVDLRFIEYMLKKYPKWCGEQEKVVFKMTKPFGSI